MSNDSSDANSCRPKPQAPQTDRVAGTDDTRRERGKENPAKTGAETPGALLVRCPHCSGTVNFVDDGSLKKIECDACGNEFSLIGGEETVTYRPGGGKTIANFRLIERVGTGRYGGVWKAHDVDLDRFVAVKIPHRGRLDAAETEQFFREARAAAQIQHPNVVGVHEVGREEDSVYIVSDFIEGANLAELLTAKRLTPVEAVELCLKLADSLHTAHEAGVVHRDLKPGNIMIGLDGEPHITDFGLARRESGEVTMTMDGQVMGTPAYMSPEQARGEGHRADRRSDIYSLGVIMYELLTGARPFQGDFRMLVVQILRDEPVSLRTLDKRIPRDLETICLKCLEKSPKQRYQSARQVVEELRHFLDGEPVQSRPVGTIGRMWRWYRRHPDSPVLAAGGFGTFLAVVLILWGFAGVGIYLAGIHPTHDATGAMADIVLLMAFFYCPLLWAGIRTLNHRISGLWFGAALWTVAVVLSLAGLAAITFDTGTYGDMAVRMPLFSFLAIMSLIALILHVVAIISRITATKER